MPNWGRIQRGNFKDPRTRRNWNKMATLASQLFGNEFQFGSNGELQLARGSTEKWNAYDDLGGLSVLTTPQTIPFNLERLNSDSTIFTDLTNGVLTIAGGGEPFLFTATTTAQHVGAVETNWQCRMWLEVKIGSTWVEVPGSSVNMGNRE